MGAKKKFAFTKEMIKNLREIGVHVIENYGESAMYINHCGDKSYVKTIDDVTLLEELFKYFIIDIGLHDADDYHILAVRKIADYLDIISNWKDGNDDNPVLWFDDPNAVERSKMMQEKLNTDYISNDPLILFMAYTLNNKGLTEYWSSIDGCYLTEKGKMYLYVFKIYLEKFDSDKEGDNK